jgi:hypothetical protein
MVRFFFRASESPSAIAQNYRHDEFPQRAAGITSFGSAANGVKCRQQFAPLPPAKFSG